MTVWAVFGWFLPVSVTHAAALRRHHRGSPAGTSAAVSGPGYLRSSAREARPYHSRQGSGDHQTKSSTNNPDSGQPPRAEERRSAGGTPRHQMRPRGAPHRPSSANSRDRGTTNNGGGEGHPRRESSSHTSTSRAGSSSPAARGQPHPAAASSSGTQTNEPTVESTNHQPKQRTHRSSGKRWRPRASPCGRAPQPQGVRGGPNSGYERHPDTLHPLATGGRGREWQQVGAAIACDWR